MRKGDQVFIKRHVENGKKEILEKAIIVTIRATSCTVKLYNGDIIKRKLKDIVEIDNA